MKENIEERTILTARHIADSHQTIRYTADMFGISKSTLHHDISSRLEKIDGRLFDRVKEVLEENFSSKHIRGGEATKRACKKAREMGE